jgi:hypothetical protein
VGKEKKSLRDVQIALPEDAPKGPEAELSLKLLNITPFGTTLEGRPYPKSSQNPVICLPISEGTSLIEAPVIVDTSLELNVPDFLIDLVQKNIVLRICSKAGDFPLRIIGIRSPRI